MDFLFWMSFISILFLSGSGSSKEKKCEAAIECGIGDIERPDGGREKLMGLSLLKC